MTNKIVEIGPDARDKVVMGANFLANAVKMSLGPYGRNGLFGPKGGGQTRITNDGVSIAKEVTLSDEIMDLGVRALREAALKTNDRAGDGTTTAITLAQAILAKAMSFLGSGNVVANKISAMALRKKILDECEEVIGKLKDMAVQVTSREQLIRVAEVSVEDDALAELIGSAQWDVGADGSLVAEDSNDREDSVERVQGVRIDNGLATSLAINNHEKGTLELKNVRVILTNYTFAEMHGLKPALSILQMAMNAGIREIVLIARGFNEAAIQDCRKNGEKGFNIYPINAPYMNHREVMLDLEAALGARFLNVEENDSFNDLVISDIGLATAVSIGRWSAIFTGEKNEINDQRIRERVTLIEKQLLASGSEFEKKNIQERISQMQDGFGIVKVTGLTETERRRKRDKVDDAVNSVKAALEEGVIPGAGKALKTIAEGLDDSYILKEPLQAPYKQIMANAGEEFPVGDDIQDSVKVTRIALEIACQVAADLSTIEVAGDWEREKIPAWLQRSNSDSK